MRVIVLVCVLAFVGVVSAEPTAKDLAKAKAAVALADIKDSNCCKCDCGCGPDQPCFCKTKPKVKVVPRLNYSEGIAECFRTGKTLVVHVAGFDCGNVCQELAGELVAADSPIAFGDATPRMVVFHPTGSGGLRVVREFTSPPTALQMRGLLTVPQQPISSVTPQPIDWQIRAAPIQPITPVQTSALRQLSIGWQGRYTSGQICVGSG